MALILPCPGPDSQETVAQNVVAAQRQISVLASQVTTASENLTEDISNATDGVAVALKGVEGVLAASGLSPADVGVDLPPAQKRDEPPPTGPQAPPLPTSPPPPPPPTGNAIAGSEPIIQPVRAPNLELARLN